jgi:hypothetical protein
MTRRVPLGIVIVTGASAIGIWAVWSNLSQTDPLFPLFWIWVFYAPAWLLCNALFGGIHGAAGWTMLPSIVLAVGAQNVVIYFVCRLLRKRFTRRQQL